MEFDTPKVNFILRESDISTSNIVGDYPLANSVGSVNQYRTSITWNAVNIKNILGSLYDNYELFNLEIRSISNPIPTTLFGVTDNDRAITFKMSGLDWVFNTYDTSSGNTTNQAIIGNQRFSNQTTTLNTVGIRRMTTTFRKCITANITINLYNINNAPPDMNAGTIWPQLIFAFKITPVS